MKIDSNDLLVELKRLLRRLSEIVVNDFTSLSNTQLHWKPDAHRWSIAECLHHLNILSEYYLPSLQTKIERSIILQQKPKLLFHSGWLGQYLAKSMQLNEQQRLKSKAKSPKAYQPNQVNLTKQGQKIIEQYLQDQQVLLELLEKCHQVPLMKVKIPIAIFKIIRLRLGDMLRFLTFHNERHIVQAQLVLSEELFPSH